MERSSHCLDNGDAVGYSRSGLELLLAGDMSEVAHPMSPHHDTGALADLLTNVKESPLPLDTALDDFNYNFGDPTAIMALDDFLIKYGEYLPFLPFFFFFFNSSFKVHWDAIPW